MVAFIELEHRLDDAIILSTLIMRLLCAKHCDPCGKAGRQRAQE